MTFLPLTNLVEVDELRIPIPGATPPMDPVKVFGTNLGVILGAIVGAIEGAVFGAIFGSIFQDLLKINLHFGSYFFAVDKSG